MSPHIEKISGQLLQVALVLNTQNAIVDPVQNLEKQNPETKSNKHLTLLAIPTSGTAL